MKLEMPKEFFGDYIDGGQYTKSQPRKWTSEEVMWCKEKMEEGYSYSEIAEAAGRTEVSVSIKMKREKKKDNKYNINYRDDKYKHNKEFVELIEPKSVLDCFSGVANYYNNKEDIPVVVTNDKDVNIEADNHMDYLKFLCQEYVLGNKYDIVDLDPFGSAYDGFDLAIKMANKGIIVTFGEMGHKRWKRLDYVSTHYGIDNLDDFTIDSLIQEVQKIGLRNKKQLTPIIVMNQKLISRVWFQIKDIKITSQWD